MNFGKPHRHEPTEPQLATMVDVFSILIIFLILGTAMNSSIIQLPAGLKLPQTASKGDMVNAPQITIDKTNLWLSLNAKTYSIENFLHIEKTDRNYLEIQSAVQDFEKKSKKSKSTIEAASPAQYLNLVADANVAYETIFPVIKYFRSLGFKSIILVGSMKNETSSQ